MNRNNVENYKLITRIADFAAKNVELLPKSSPGLEVQKKLATVVRELDELYSARITAETALRSGRKERVVARDVLKGLLAHANRTARALDSESLRNATKPTDHSLVAAGRAFAAEIEPMKKEFIGYGISPEDVAAAVKEMEGALRDFATGKAKRAAAVQDFSRKLDEATGYVRRFEALVDNYLANNSTAMAEWAVARTASRTVRKRKAAEPVVPPSQPQAA